MKFISKEDFWEKLKKADMQWMLEWDAIKRADCFLEDGTPVHLSDKTKASLREKSRDKENYLILIPESAFQR